MTALHSNVMCSIYFLPCGSLQWRGRLLEFGAARTVGRSKQAVPTPWSNNFNLKWFAFPLYFWTLTSKWLIAVFVILTALLVLWPWGAPFGGWEIKLKVEQQSYSILFLNVRTFRKKRYFKNVCSLLLFNPFIINAMEIVGSIFVKLRFTLLCCCQVGFW